MNPTIENLALALAPLSDGTRNVTDDADRLTRYARTLQRMHAEELNGPENRHRLSGSAYGNAISAWHQAAPEREKRAARTFERAASILAHYGLAAERNEDGRGPAIYVSHEDGTRLHPWRWATLGGAYVPMKGE